MYKLLIWGYLSPGYCCVIRVTPKCTFMGWEETSPYNLALLLSLTCSISWTGWDASSWWVTPSPPPLNLFDRSPTYFCLTLQTNTATTLQFKRNQRARNLISFTWGCTRESLWKWDKRYWDYPKRSQALRWKCLPQEHRISRSLPRL